MNYKEITKLLLFPLGIPSVFYLRLGMLDCETDSFQIQLDQCETEDTYINEFLQKYDVKVETSSDERGRIYEIRILIPAMELPESQIKTLVDSISHQIDTQEKKYSITNSSDDSISVLNASIHTDLYDVNVRAGEGQDHVVIAFSTDDVVKLDMLRCLAIIADNDRDFYYNIMKFIEGQKYSMND